MKKPVHIISIILTLSIIIGMASPLSTAANNIDESINNTIIEVSGEPITAEEAATYAYIFINDMIGFDDTSSWSYDTRIGNIVTMYGVNDEITGYTFELTSNGEDNGYILISTYNNVLSIKEFSDYSAPIYQVMEPEVDDKILYTGTMDYYIMDVEEQIISLDNEPVEKEEITNTLAEEITAEKVQDSTEILEVIREEGTIPNVLETEGYSGTDGYGAISDPFAYCTSKYGGTFTANNWINDFEYAAREYLTMSRFQNISGFSSTNHCTPTAITNLLYIYYWWGPFTMSTPHPYYDNTITTFKAVAAVGINNGYYTVSGGSLSEYIPLFIKKSFALYGGTVYTTRITCTIADVKAQLANQRPFILSTIGHATYGNHSTVCYAYTTINSSSRSVTFMKVLDGWSSSGRYIEFGSSLYMNTVNF